MALCIVALTALASRGRRNFRTGLDPVSPVQSVTRQEVQAFVSSGSAQLVEVLPREDYEQEHLTGAVNIPLKELTVEGVGRLDRTAPVVVYCNDFL
jgi:rhodanese-related sulfurtransferase